MECSDSKLYELDENHYQIISKLFFQNLNAGEVLEKVHPGLKTLYENRSYHYESNKDIKSKISKVYFFILSQNSKRKNEQ